MANDLVPSVDVSQYAIMRGPGAAIVKENLAGDQVTASDLPRLRVPTAGGRNWELPDGSSASTFEGIIIYSALQKAMWEGSTPTPGTPPACFGRVNPATGAWIGQGNPGGDCAICPFNAFGSEVRQDGQPGKGKACGDKRLALIAIPGSMLPVVLYVPATSLSNFRKYLLGLNARYQNVVTRFALEQDKSASGIVYSKVVPTKVGNIPTEAIPQVDEMIRNMASLFHQVMAQAPSETE